MSPGRVKEYLELMHDYGVQNLQIEEGNVKLIISGIYKDIQPLTEEDDISREEALDKLRE